MTFIKLLIFDMKNGSFKNKFSMLAFFILPVVLFLDFHHKSSSLPFIQADGHVVTTGDYMMYIFGGMKEYIPSPSNPFIFPVSWMILFLSLFYGTLNYPYHDLETVGQQILLRTKGRKLWWMSKCIWNVLHTLFFYVIFFLILLTLFAIAHVPFSTKVNLTTVQLIYDVLPQELVTENIQIPNLFFLATIMISVSMNLFQMTLSLFIKPIFSFLFTAILLLSSVYFVSPYLIGNYCMALRSDTILVHGVSFVFGILGAFILLVISITIGMVRFNRYDIMGKEIGGV